MLLRSATDSPEPRTSAAGNSLVTTAVRAGRTRYVAEIREKWESVTDVKKLLEDLQAQRRSLDEVAAIFWDRQWPQPEARPATSGDELMRRLVRGRAPEPEGAFAEVAFAFYSRVIDLDQYDVLAEAAAAGIAIG